MLERSVYVLREEVADIRFLTDGGFSGSSWGIPTYASREEELRCQAHVRPPFHLPYYAVIVIPADDTFILHKSTVLMGSPLNQSNGVKIFMRSLKLREIFLHDATGNVTYLGIKLTLFNKNSFRKTPRSIHGGLA